MPFSHNRNQYNLQISKKNNFVFYKKINNFNYDPTFEFINIVENEKFSFLYESVEKGKDKGGEQ